ncbi:MAG: 1-phosphofructokinase family hexose kinase [Clostridia bacterium]|jgi:1-phosphofructokinase family hexose kinase|nr:1-phosphofructokinase family hexose kinase [Clostridia bacterium]
MIIVVSLNPAIDTMYLMENFGAGKVQRPVKVLRSAGGKGMNVARVATCLGEQVCLTGLIGGANGSSFEKMARQSGIKTCLLPIEGETRICINVVDGKTGECTEILEKGPTVQKKEYDLFLEQYDALLKEATVVVLSGSLPRGLPADAYRSLIRMAKQQKISVLLDTSGEALLEGIKEIPTAIKPNEDEMAELFPKVSANPSNLGKELLNLYCQGIHFPMVSMGKDGVLVPMEKDILQYSLPLDQVINTVGSGDAFMAGLAVGIHRGYEEHEILTLACACGSANTQFQETGYVEQELVKKFRTLVEVKKVL